MKVENEKEMDGVYAYKVQCLGLGETQITLRFDSLRILVVKLLYDTKCPSSQLSLVRGTIL